MVFGVRKVVNELTRVSRGKLCMMLACVWKAVAQSSLCAATLVRKTRQAISHGVCLTIRGMFWSVCWMT